MNMKITKEEVVRKLLSYLNHSSSLEELVDWAESAICEAEYDERDFELIRNILGHLGLANVREFGLSWDDCYNYLSQLGYQVKVTVY